MPIRGLVFDFDGLILDTETPEFIVLQEIYQAHGLNLAPELWAAAVGASLDAFHPIEHLQSKLPYSIDPTEVHRQWLAKSRQVIDQSGPLPGVMNILMRARELGLRMAIASSSPKDWVATHMSRLNLEDWFEIVLTKDHVTNVKPNPELYLSAVDKLGIMPEEAIAFEDSPNGIQAAINAGLFTVAVPNPVTRLMDTSRANLVLESLQTMPLDAIIALADRKNGK